MLAGSSLLDVIHSFSQNLPQESFHMSLHWIDTKESVFCLLHRSWHGWRSWLLLSQLSKSQTAPKSSGVKRQLMQLCCMHCMNCWYVFLLFYIDSMSVQSPLMNLLNISVFMRWSASVLLYASSQWGSLWAPCWLTVYKRQITFVHWQQSLVTTTDAANKVSVFI